MNTPTDTETAVATETAPAPAVVAAPARRGAAPRPLSWPSGEFSVADALNHNNSVIQKPAMAMRIRAAIKAGQLVQLTATRPVPNKGAGRPAFLFRVA